MRSVIMFHGIQDEPSDLAVNKEELASILSAVRDNGFAIRPLREVLTAAPNAAVVALTFDGGLATVKDAAEVLADFDAPATLFAVTGYVGKTNRWPGQIEGTPAQRLLGWADLQALRDEGWEIQALSHSHPDLRQLPDSHVIKELDRCKSALYERLGIETHTFAYPYGYLNRRIYDLVKARFDYALTTMLSEIPEVCDPHLVPRIDAKYLWPKPIHHYYGRRRFRLYLHGRRQIRRWQSHPGEPNIEELFAD